MIYPLVLSCIVILIEIDDEKSVKSITFSLNRLSRRHVHVLHLKKMISDNMFIVVYRSVDFDLNSESQESQGNVNLENLETSEYDLNVISDENHDSNSYLHEREKSETNFNEFKQFKESREIHRSNSFDASLLTSPLADNLNPDSMESILKRRSAYEFKYESESVPISRKNSPERPERRRSTSSSFEVTEVNSVEKKPSPPKRGYFDSKASRIYLYGYLIEPLSLNSSQVTLVSCVSPDLSRILSDITVAYKTKTFIEELVSLTEGSSKGFENKIENKIENRNVDKLKSYIGGAASYLFSKSRSMNDSSESRTESPTDGLQESPLMTSTTQIKTIESPIVIPPFVDEDYVEREIGGKEIHDIPLPFDPLDFSCPIELNWEFMSKTEMPILFGIVFVPLDPKSQGPWNSCFECNESHHWILFPKCNVSAFAKPAFGRMSLLHFPKGKFILTFDNSQKKSIQSLSTRCWIQKVQDNSLENSTQDNSQNNSQENSLYFPTTEVFAEIYIPRKSYMCFSFPFESCNFENEKSRIHLEWNVSVGTDVQFVVFYQEFEKNVLPDLEDSQLHTEKVEDPFVQDEIEMDDKSPSFIQPVSTLNSTETFNSNANTNANTNLNKTSLSSKTSKFSSYPANEIPSRTKEAISSRLNNSVKNPTSIDILDEVTRLFTLNHPRALVLFPSTRISSKNHPSSWKGSIDITRKYGVYTIVFDNLNSVVVGKSLSLDLSIKSNVN